MIKRLFKCVVFTLLAYLLQATTAIHISLWDVAPNIALAMIAIVSVGLGRKYAFFMSLAVGYMLEVMLPMLDYFNLILYPVCAMLGALVFSDKSERRVDEERTSQKVRGSLNPHIRTPLCAFLSVSIFEGVHFFYLYLSGVSIDNGHITRALIDIVYTSVLSGLIQFPGRWWLDVYKVPRAR